LVEKNGNIQQEGHSSEENERTDNLEALKPFIKNETDMPAELAHNNYGNLEDSNEVEQVMQEASF